MLSGIRQPLLEVVSRRYQRLSPMIRVPSDRPASILARSGSPRLKAAAVAVLAVRFGAHARRLGLPTNEVFSGFSSFSPGVPYAAELADAFTVPGPRHIVMCHPGHADDELAALDAVVERRRMEYDALMRDTALPGRIWRPERSADGPPVDWQRLQG